MKARLCNKDMCNLVDLLRELPEALQGVGVDGNMTSNGGENGEIISTLAVAPESTLTLEISDDGRKGAWEYIDD